MPKKTDLYGNIEGLNEAYFNSIKLSFGLRKARPQKPTIIFRHKSKNIKFYGFIKENLNQGQEIFPVLKGKIIQRKPYFVSREGFISEKTRVKITRYYGAESTQIPIEIMHILYAWKALNRGDVYFFSTFPSKKEYENKPLYKFYVVEPYIDGMDLLSFLKKDNPTFLEKMDILYKIVLQLEQLHTAGSVHGDLNIKNIIVKREKGKIVVNLINFEHTVKNGAKLNIPLTTQGYDAPEVAPANFEDKKERIYTGRSDIYAFGIICAMVLCISAQEIKNDVKSINNLKNEFRQDFPEFAQLIADDAAKRPTIQQIKTELLNFAQSYQTLSLNIENFIASVTCHIEQIIQTAKGNFIFDKYWIDLFVDCQEKYKQLISAEKNIFEKLHGVNNFLIDLAVEPNTPLKFINGFKWLITTALDESRKYVTQISSVQKEIITNGKRCITSFFDFSDGTPEHFSKKICMR